MGAKNHGVIMPDANKQAVLNALQAAAFGASGQRCMALSCVVFVGSSAAWLPELAQAAAKIKAGFGLGDPSVGLGPVISPAAKERIAAVIAAAEREGATVLLDGRGLKVRSWGPPALSCCEAWRRGRAGGRGGVGRARRWRLIRTATGWGPPSSLT